MFFAVRTSAKLQPMLQRMTKAPRDKSLLRSEQTSAASA
jgi:hypothetical protein